MNKNIADYLPYYIGQDVWFIYETRSLYPHLKHDKRVGTIIGIGVNGVTNFIDVRPNNGTIHRVNIVNIKLLLRPLSDMTLDEREIFGWQEDWIFEDKSDPNQPLKTTFLVWEFIDLLKMGFDLFGLIESGLAVDKTKEVTNATN